jgi:chromosome segregation ATPase
MHTGNRRNFIAHGSVVAMCCFTLCSCASDPTTGGIFWSESKAKQRLVALRGELAEEDMLLAQARRQLAQARNSLDRDISSTRSQLASSRSENPSFSRKLSEIERQRDAIVLSNANTADEIARDREQLASLQSEVDILRKKTEALQSSL